MEHRKAHLRIALRPKEQTRAQRRTDRTITTFMSKLPNPGRGCGSEDGVATAVAVAVAEGRRNLLDVEIDMWACLC